MEPGWFFKRHEPGGGENTNCGTQVMRFLNPLLDLIDVVVTAFTLLLESGDLILLEDGNGIQEE